MAVNDNKDFANQAEALTKRENNESLQRNWDDAIAFGSGSEADAFWIRDSEDLINIVWLNADGIRDIAFVKEHGESMFNFVPIRKIATIETRQGENISGAFGLGVEGSYMIHVIVTARLGNLYWIGESPDSIARLRKFSHAVFAALSQVNRY